VHPLAVCLKPGNEEAPFNLGSVRQAENMLPEAPEPYRAARKLEPGGGRPDVAACATAEKLASQPGKKK